MTRKELDDLIFLTVREAGVSLEFGEPTQLTDALSVALWPVLAQIYDEGFLAGERYGSAYQYTPSAPNPYEVSA